MGLNIRMRKTSRLLKFRFRLGFGVSPPVTPYFFIEMIFGFIEVPTSLELLHPRVSHKPTYLALPLHAFPFPTFHA